MSDGPPQSIDAVAPEPAEGISARSASLATYEEVLRLRDLLIGKEAELGAVKGELAELKLEARRFERLVDEYDDLEKRHEAILSSTTWRVGQRLLAPLRRLRGD